MPSLHRAVAPGGGVGAGVGGSAAAGEAAASVAIAIAVAANILLSMDDLLPRCCAHAVVPEYTGGGYHASGGYTGRQEMGSGVSAQPGAKSAVWCQGQ